MKKINILLLLSVLILAFSACSDDDDSKDVKDIEILGTDNDTIFLMRYDQHQLEIKTDPKNADVTYVSNNAKVFTVSPTGMIEAMDGGFGHLIVVAPNGESWTQTKCVVHVTALVDSISLVPGNKYTFIDAGNTFDAGTVYSGLPKTAANRTLRYEIEDPAIASVDANGIVTPLTTGITKLKAISTDGDNIESEFIWIYSKYPRPALNTTGWTVTASSIYSLSYYNCTNLIDGLAGSSNAWMSGTAGLPHWILIDMKSVQQFDKILIQNSVFKYLKTMKIYVSTKDENGVTHDDGSFVQIDQKLFLANYDSQASDYLPEVHSARYVKLVMPDTYASYAGMVGFDEITFYKVP
ncbi:discoidin domain-containing protein [Dysgonomonas sp. 25]|uniref:discoidin domain-containing protein n=1 Tax=Dysgonomonas sp. 25 TaxID=2302933 RepID=UPI0013D88B11|nr:discoidin domain-containing protein [Dysgonomonas sp. 25]NDV68842.1 hypothetical protein [Dysgonomonas sp. 25]